MNKKGRVIGMIGIVLCSMLPGFTTCGQSSLSVAVNVPMPAVEIRVESDFYEPLTPYGRWEVVGSYGRCWVPARVETNWRPYCNGNWQRTDAGWYWVSDEPWAWATYHYGRWDFTTQYGWYWVPQTQWAPAWVSWHSGGGYIGWAPLLPSVRISAGGFVGFNASVISPRAFVFVEQRQFLEPIRPTTVVVHNTTIINRTTTITNTKIVNNTVINEGPATAVIEKASGRKVKAVPVGELRHRQEAAVVSKPSTPATTTGKKDQTPVRSESELREEKIVAAPAPAPAQVQEPPTATHKQSTEPKVGKHIVKQEKSAKPSAKKVQRPANVNPTQPSDRKDQQPAKENPPASEKNEPNPVDKDHENKPKE